MSNDLGQVTNKEIGTNTRYSNFFTVKPSNIRMLPMLYVFGRHLRTLPNKVHVPVRAVFVVVYY